MLLYPSSILSYAPMDSSRSLAGEKVKVVIKKAPEQELESFSSIKSDETFCTLLRNACMEERTLNIELLCLPVYLVFLMDQNLLTRDIDNLRQSAGALNAKLIFLNHAGRIMLQAVSLIASYLQVPLRYPLRLGGSRSYIRDYSPSIEHSASSTTLDSTTSASTKPVEFPLCVEGQDSTRAAYAVFLLNKDLEQLLNFIGVKSLGPRQVLANLKELTRTILSPEYIDM
ncbi:UNVERIFIED_CONTAM: hypothetical protein Scaly_2760900 [Sesamum calycinum]|uniref:Uncharacterized protein n=1 Tax=Sesamum calycinum TaxID=2727403 RepID=A0AAW2J0K1_9LAMI